MFNLQRVQFIVLGFLGFYEMVAQAQIVGIGQSCPDYDVNVVKDFKLQQYVGSWYENQKYISDHQVGHICVKLNLDKTNDNEVKIQSTGIQRLTRRNTLIEGTARLANATVAKFTANFPKNFLATKDTPYLVLGTDYTSYSVIWSCTTRGPFYYLHTLWIHTREIIPSQSTIDKALEVVRKNALNLDKLRLTRHQNC